jgi:NNP family nitrate/nitrite transporter-like MFS transporter
MDSVVPAAIALVTFGLFVHIAAGATYSVVPFIKPNGVGAVAGIVGAGGNVGAVLAGMLFRNKLASTQSGLLWLGGAVLVAAALAALVRFGKGQAQAAAELAPSAVAAE